MYSSAAPRLKGRGPKTATGMPARRKTRESVAGAPIVRPGPAPQISATFRRMSAVQGRADEMLKLRGISIYPTAIERALRTFPELGMQWFLVLDRSSSSQEITVQVESTHPLGPEPRNELAARVSDHLKQQIGVRPAVSIFDPGALISTQSAEGRVKTSRIIDRTATLASHTAPGSGAK